MGVHQARRPPESAGRQEVVGGQDQQVVAVRPLDPLVVGRDVTAVDEVAAVEDAGVARRQLRADLLRVVPGGVVQDQRPDLHALLGLDAPDARREEVSVVVTGDDDVDSTHALPSPGSARPWQKVLPR